MIKTVCRMAAALAFAAAMFSASCSTESPDLNVHIGWGIVEEGVVNEVASFSILMDNGARLYIESNMVPKFVLENGQRVVVNYTILGTVPESSAPAYNVRVNMFYGALSKELLAQSYIDSEEGGIDEDSVGHDRINVGEASFGGGFLNLRLEIWQNNKTHLVNLVYDDTADPAVVGDTAVLTLRHNAFGDAQTRSGIFYASFPLTGLVVPPKTSRPIKLVWKDYNGQTYSSKGVFVLHEAAGAPAGYLSRPCLIATPVE